jgi:hypothetical protein
MRMPQYTAEACLSFDGDLNQRLVQHRFTSLSAITPQFAEQMCCETGCVTVNGVKHCFRFC